MGAKQFVRGENAVVPRTERAALRRHRTLLAAQQRHVEGQQLLSAVEQVRQFENFLMVLTTVHADCGAARDWKAIALAAPPPEPLWVESESHEAIARAGLVSYRPGFLERLFGGHTEVIARLEAAVHDARARDHAEQQRRLAGHREVFEAWRTQTRMAHEVLRLEPKACTAALDQGGAFDELRSLGANVDLVAIENTHVLVVHRIGYDVVPRREIALAATGKLAIAMMAATRREALFKEHVCSCAFRIAREVFAALPVTGVRVRAELSRVESGGRQIQPAMLDVHFERTEFSRLSFDAIQPSTVLAAFPHRASFYGDGRLDVGGPQRSTSDRGAPAPAASAHHPSTPTSPRAADGHAAGAVHGAPGPTAPDEALREADSDPESQFSLWLAAHVDGRANVQFKVKTLVNQLGRFRADRRLSFKAVHDLAGVLASAGYETEPDLDVMERSPGIEARVRISRKLSPEERRSKAFRDAAPSVALLRFLWGAGYRRLALSTAVPPYAEDASVETTRELVEQVHNTPRRSLAVLEHLIATGALEGWLLDAQRNAVLATFASGLRHDAEARKAERWLAEATRIVGPRRAPR